MTNIIKRGRILGLEDDVFSQNAWDDTEWTEEMQQDAERRIQEQVQEAADLVQHTERLPNIELSVKDRWNDFYDVHEDKFFKDRKWLFAEFPELLQSLKEDSGPCKILEVGCGVGNAVVHIIDNNANKDLKIFCCDLSHNAITTLKKREFYLNNQDKLFAFQSDITQAFSHDQHFPVASESLDFIMLIFTLSAINPQEMSATIISLAKLLKPGGMLLLRDYGRYDLTQLRFKGKSYLGDNYYVRQDGTTSYFFTMDKLEQLFEITGCLDKIELKQDNRLLVNRKKCLKMCRCWIQAKYKKR